MADHSDRRRVDHLIGLAVACSLLALATCGFGEQSPPAPMAFADALLAELADDSRDVDGDRSRIDNGEADDLSAYPRGLAVIDSFVDADSSSGCRERLRDEAQLFYFASPRIAFLRVASQLVLHREIGQDTHEAMIHWQFYRVGREASEDALQRHVLLNLLWSGRRHTRDSGWTVTQCIAVGDPIEKFVDAFEITGEVEESIRPGDLHFIECRRSQNDGLTLREVHDEGWLSTEEWLLEAEEYPPQDRVVLLRHEGLRRDRVAADVLAKGRWTGEAPLVPPIARFSLAMRDGHLVVHGLGLELAMADIKVALHEPVDCIGTLQAVVQRPAIVLDCADEVPISKCIEVVTCLLEEGVLAVYSPAADCGGGQGQNATAEECARAFFRACECAFRWERSNAMLAVPFVGRHDRIDATWGESPAPSCSLSRRLSEACVGISSATMCRTLVGSCHPEARDHEQLGAAIHRLSWIGRWGEPEDPGFEVSIENVKFSTGPSSEAVVRVVVRDDWHVPAARTASFALRVRRTDGRWWATELLLTGNR